MLAALFFVDHLYGRYQRKQRYKSMQIKCVCVCVCVCVCAHYSKGELFMNQ